MQLSVLCKMCIKCNRVSCAIHVVRLAHYHLFTSVTASCLEISSALNASSVLARLKTAFSSNVTAALVRWVPTVISDGNSHLTARWIFFDSFWLGPTLFRSQTLPGIARVTTEDLDEMRPVGFFFRPPNCLVVAIEFQIGPEMDFFRFFLAATEIVSA